MADAKENEASCSDQAEADIKGANGEGHTQGQDKLGQSQLSKNVEASGEADLAEEAEQNLVEKTQNSTHMSSQSKRNSLEIRNNIPDVNEVKSYDSDSSFENVSKSKGSVPRISKKSPGLARRLNENTGSGNVSSGSEKEGSPSLIDTTVRSAQKDFESGLIQGEKPVYVSGGNNFISRGKSPSSDNSNGIDSNTSSMQASSNQSMNDAIESRIAMNVQDFSRESSKSPDKDMFQSSGNREGSVNRDSDASMENEYNYVKYARIHHGDSYVGMRLAYSTQNEIEGHDNSDPYIMSSSREASPEKQHSFPSEHQYINEQIPKVNEDTLTEIPLNGSEHLRSDPRNFSLSPEPTECDSAEVESVLSDEGKSETSGMPVVEDGLSSSHGSDDNLADPQPSEILKQRYQKELEHSVKKVLQYEVNPNSMIGAADVSFDESREDMKKEALDMAIKDIRSALRQNEGAMLSGSDEHDDCAGKEPVWIMRDTYVHRHRRQDEFDQVRDEIEKSQYKDGVHRDNKNVYHMENDNEGVPRQYSQGNGKSVPPNKDFDTDEETDELLNKQYSRNEKVDIPELDDTSQQYRQKQREKRRSRVREVALRDPNNDTVLIEGVLFRAKYLGSTQLISEGQPSKGMRMMQAQEAVGRIKAPEGEAQPSTEVDLFVSTEKIMVLNTDLQEIMMDHSLRTISYIADIGDILVLMARRGPVNTGEGLNMKRQSKICCHVFDSEEAQLIAQSIGQAFQVAYMEFLKANGIDDPGMMKEMDYQEVLNQQEIFGEELQMFADKETQKEVIVPKMKNEPLGVVIVESGWGSMVPTVVLANMASNGAASRCGQLNIGDQIMAINGISLVGLPLSSCQNYIKMAKTQTVVKLSVVSCPPVVEVLIKRPDVKYQLGFSVQNGVICSLLRGGIAERGGVRVGHRIIEINSTSVVAVPHEKIVTMLANAVGEIHMKTMPTSIFRLLTGQETPHFI